MKTLIAFILFTCFTAAWANECLPSNNSCDAYLCLEQKHGCGYKGYPLRFGYRFCRNFLDLNPKSERLKKWLDEVRYCLQDKLVTDDSLQCSNMFYGSINAHVSCYTDTGYCQLNKSEKNYIKKVILKEFMIAPIYIIKNAKQFFKKACRE